MPAATDVPSPISSAGTITSQTIVAGVIGTLTDVNVSLSLNHTNDEDLDIFLVAPDGTMVELASDVGGSGDNFANSVFDQQAATVVNAGTVPFTGSFRPEGSLDALAGGSPAGTWTLIVSDDTAGNQMARAEFHSPSAMAAASRPLRFSCCIVPRCSM